MNIEKLTSHNYCRAVAEEITTIARQYCTNSFEVPVGKGVLDAHYNKNLNKIYYTYKIFPYPEFSTGTSMKFINAALKILSRKDYINVNFVIYSGNKKIDFKNPLQPKMPEKYDYLTQITFEYKAQ